MASQKNREEAERLIERYLAGKASEEEKKLVETWYLDYYDRQENHLTEVDLEAIKSTLDARLERKSPKQAFDLRWLGAVASILLIFGSIATLYYFGNNDKNVPSSAEQLVQDVEPGGNHATLTLANGEKILLDSVANGTLTEDSGIKITKTEDGQIVYEIQGGATPDYNLKLTTYNAIQTPRGGQYKIILPDSSCVWLNAASSLRYPTRFSGAERRVELTGEAYFEVAKGKAPFVVATETQEVQVLGTHFNINAYENEPTVSTTLIEGSVRVSFLGDEQQRVTLMPNQQAQLTDKGFNVKNVDVEEAVAWKDNLFYFDGAELNEVMRQLERWYDVEVDYRNLPKKQFNGEISRNVPLSAVIKAMEETSNLKFKVEERRIMLID